LYIYLQGADFSELCQKKKGNVRPDTLQLFGARLQLEKNEREASQFLMARITESALDAATHT
jgi:hypothetical protein